MSSLLYHTCHAYHGTALCELLWWINSIIADAGRSKTLYPASRVPATAFKAFAATPPRLPSAWQCQGSPCIKCKFSYHLSNFPHQFFARPSWGDGRIDFRRAGLRCFQFIVLVVVVMMVVKEGAYLPVLVSIYSQHPDSTGWNNPIAFGRGTLIRAA